MRSFVAVVVFFFLVGVPVLVTVFSYIQAAHGGEVALWWDATQDSNALSGNVVVKKGKCPDPRPWKVSAVIPGSDQTVVMKNISSGRQCAYALYSTRTIGKSQDSNVVEWIMPVTAPRINPGIRVNAPVLVR